MLVVARKQAGASLLELVIAIAVMAGMIGLSIPAVSDWADNNRIKATADAMINGLQLAKMEAVRQNTQARFALLDVPTYTVAAGGQAGDWEICTADNTGSFIGNQGQVWVGTEVGTPARIGVSTAALTGQNFSTPLTAGAGLTGLAPGCVGTTTATTNVNVTFDAMGRSTTAGNITRIDILNSRTNNSKKRLVITINPQGQIKLCNPASLDVNQQCG